MTLYLLFEQLEEGKLKLDTPLPVSAHAAVQPPTRMGLKTNGTVTIEDAIKGLVTKSANDAAAAVGEAIGGTEEDFAKLMTAKAHELGMANTTYVNASGLPADEQITTARDQALLATEIQHRFPVYYRYFATPSFVYHGTEMRNHNMLLGQVKGVDGIKTGYTDASGYNLVSSVRRDNKHLIGVVLGGTSNESRDARMRQLIEDHINLCAVGAATPAVATAADAPVAALAPPPPPSKPTIVRAKITTSKGNLAAPPAGRGPNPPAAAPGARAPQVAAAKTPRLQTRRDTLKSSATAAAPAVVRQ
jgi:D-alanyl-D-alanine carboxypeptidase